MSSNGGCPNNLFADECQLEICDSGWNIVNDFSEFDLNSTFSLLCDTGFEGAYLACGLCDTIYDYSACCKANPAGGDAAYSCMNSYIQTASECTSGTMASQLSVYTSLLTEQLNITTSGSGQATTTTALDLTSSSAGMLATTSATSPVDTSVASSSGLAESSSAPITPSPTASSTATPSTSSTKASSEGSRLQVHGVLLSLTTSMLGKWGILITFAALTALSSV